jgi:phytoene dehydrogenase-like protein
VRSLDDFSSARAILCDVTPRQMIALAGSRLSAAYRRALERFRYGPAAFKVDWALSGPIPWRDPNCARAGTLHLGGTLEEIASAERQVARGQHPERPFVLLCQPSRFDASRSPPGRHTGWAYAHVPHASDRDMTDAIERQVERFAPGFRDLILRRSTMSPADLERHNPNLVGGDIAGGASDLRQLLLRPTFHHYRTSARGLYLCSASTPPGGGVHGMCGHWAARRALREVFGMRSRSRAHA